MILAEWATPGILKTKLFWNKGSDLVNFINDATNIILSCSSNYIVDVVMWPNFGYSSIFMIEVIITQILDGFDQKTNFEGWPSLKFNNLRLVRGMALKFYCSVSKGLTLKHLWGAGGCSQFVSPPVVFQKIYLLKRGWNTGFLLLLILL